MLFLNYNSDGTAKTTTVAPSGAVFFGGAAYKADTGELHVSYGTPQSTDPRIGGIAHKTTGEVYVTSATPSSSNSVYHGGLRISTDGAVCVGGVASNRGTGGGAFTSDDRMVITANGGAYDYDGTNDYAARGAELTGLSDGKQGTYSAWVRIDGGDGATRIILGNGADGSNNRAGLYLVSSNKVQVGGGTAGGASILVLNSSAITAGAVWLHILASYDLATPGARHLYINDVSDLTVTTFTDNTIDYTRGNWGVGGLPDASLKWNGAIAELFFHPTYIDLSVEANRRKFITAAGKPAFLGSDGSLPLGVQPLVYVPNGNPSTNLGTGGNFTVTGSLDAASTTPFDLGAVSFDPVLPAYLSDNGYSTQEADYYQSSAFARLVATTDAQSAIVRWYANAATYAEAPSQMRVGIWDGTTKQELTASAAGFNTGVVHLAAGTKTVEIVAGATNRINGAGTVEGNYLTNVKLLGATTGGQPAVSSANRLLVYGDSISIGSKATGPTNNGWTMKLRALRGSASTMSEGWGYRSLFEDGATSDARQNLVNRIAGYSPSIVWIAIGTNDYGLSGGLWSAASFQTAYADLLDKLHAALPSAAIYAQSPVVRTTETANANYSNTLGNYRTAVSNACSGRAWVTFVDGSTFITTSELDADGVHPNTTGHNLYYLAVKSALGL